MKWAKRWKTGINERKSCNVTFTLRKADPQYKVYINDQPIPQVDTAKYLGMHLDARLNWKHHVRQKAAQIRLKTRQLYWLIGRKSCLDLYSKKLVYQAIIRPIWTYGVQLWGCTKKSNRLIIQRCQNKILRLITGAEWYQRNDRLHADLEVKTIDEAIQEAAENHEARLHKHINSEALQLLNTGDDLQRLKRKKPNDLVTEIAIHAS